MSSERLAEKIVGELPDTLVLPVLRAGLARMGRTALGGAVSDDALTVSIQQLHQLETMAAAEKLRRIAELDARGACHAQGARSTADLLAQRLQLTPGEARGQADTAKGLARLPETAAMLAAGELGVGQAQTAVRALDALGAGEDLTADEQRQRTEQLDRLAAKTGPTTDRRQLRKDLDAFAHRHGSQQLADRERRAHANRHLWIGADQANPSQILIEGRLGTLAGAQLRAAVDALAGSAGPDDPRTVGQRRADALVELVRRGVGASGDPMSAAAQVLLITTPDDLHDEPGADPSTLDGVGPVSNDTARQACCDADLRHVTIDRNGEILDVGRTRRDPTPRQRAAVIARDKACTGCRRPASACHIHHIRRWSDGGATDLHNLVLVCPNCHHHLHHEGWTVTRDSTGGYTAAPPGGRRHAA